MMMVQDDDVLMKPLSWVKFEHFRDKLAVVRKDLPQKGEQWCSSGIVSSLDTFLKVIQWPRSSRVKRDCVIPGHLSIMDSVTSVLENVMGLHHPWTSVQNVSGGFGPRECGGIASSLNFCSECIRRLQSTWMWWDCIILEFLFRMYLEASIFVNVVGLHHL